MTSAERREGRYQRRRAKREAAKLARTAPYDDFEKVFSFDHLYNAYRKSRLGVRWKASTQRYIANALLYIQRTRQSLLDETFRSKGFCEFDLRERGKLRHIRSVEMQERVVQRCLCDYALIPMLSRSFIYDNGASMRHKGYSFAVKRIRRHIRGFYRQHGCKGYILLYDFSGYFDSIPHETLEKVLRRHFKDRRLLNLILHFIHCFGERGIGLGSQVSQVLALVAANRLDHYVKEVLRIKGYGRYMDDGYLISESKDKLKQCLEEIKRICDELGLKLNTRKTRIYPLWKDFSWLKIKFRLLPSGKLLQRVWRMSVIRHRRKLKKFRRKVASGVFSLSDVEVSHRAWLSHLIGLKAQRTIREMNLLYQQLFAT